MAKGKGLALIAVAGIAALAAGSSGASTGPRPVPPPPTPKPDENEGAVPQAIISRVMVAVSSQDPAAMRAEAARLRAEGWPLQAKDLEDAADEIEARTKPPTPGPVKPPTPAPVKPPAPAAVRDLVRGMTGEDVRAWQTRLRTDGYTNIVADASFGELTFAATKEWQWERDIKDDGIVGPLTRAAIGTAPKRKRGATPAPAPVKPPTPAPKPPAVSAPPVIKPPPATPTPAASPLVPAQLVNVTLRKVPAPEPVDERVKLWQDKLRALGFRSSTTKSDGKFGANTAAQTAAFQKARGLDPSGVADPITIATAYGAKVPQASPAPAAPKPPKPTEPTPSVPPLLVNIGTWRSNMKEGNKGEDVREWQSVLARYGHDVKADGDFGPLTVAATKQWQEEHRRFNDVQRTELKPDGEVGKNTRDRLAELERGKSIVAGDLDRMPADVRQHLMPMLSASTPQILGVELERHLRVTPPGLEDKELVIAFQRAHGLNATGVYGAATAEALIMLGIVPPDPREWPTKKLWRTKQRYKVALREAARRDPEREDEWLRAAGRV